MKTIRNLSFTLLLLFIFGACEEPIEKSSMPIDDLDDSALVPEEMRHRVRRNRGLPFKAKFFTIKSDPVNGEDEGKCMDESHPLFNLQIGAGKGTHLGKFDIKLWFCGSADFSYKGGEGSFVAANGDELYFHAPSSGVMGQVHPLPFEHPVYDHYFVDPFEFVGGTGRFSGATGMGYTLSFVNIFDADNGNAYIPAHQTDHRWYGKLVLPTQR